MTNKLKYGIIGAGHLGNYHAQQLNNINGVKLIGVFDLEQEKAEEFSKIYSIKHYAALKNLLTACDAVSITAPASAHFESARLALLAGCHVFVEKPFTHKIDEAKKLIALNNKQGLKVQVGHIERFNAAFANYINNVPRPVFIESHRLCSYNDRGLDVDVILDLMIHDIDLILRLNNFPVKSIVASGASILTSSLDMATARIEFVNKVAANITASRISLKQMRQMRVFEKNSYSIMDFQKQSVQKWSINKKILIEEKVSTKKNNPLYEELKLFINSIQNDLPVVVTSKDALNALEVACQIQQIIEEKK